MKNALPDTFATKYCAKKTLKQRLSYALARYKMRHEVLNERKQLANLPEALLKDIGIKREDAVQESQRTSTELPQDRVAALKHRYCQDNQGVDNDLKF